MKRFRKILSTTLLLSGSLALITSCSNTDKPSNSESSTTESEKPSNSSSSSSTSESTTTGGNGSSTTETKPTPTPTPTPTTPDEVKTEYELTISYPNNDNFVVKVEKGKMVSLNKYAKEIEGYTFVGFFSDSAYETQIFTYTVNENSTIYAKYNENSVTPTPTPEHVHTYSTEYSYDSTKHWKECSEHDSKTEEAEHTFVNEAANEYKYNDATYTSKALYYSHCSVCGAKGTLFEYGDVLHNHYTLNIVSNYDELEFETYTYIDDEVVDIETLLNKIKEHSKVKDRYDVLGLYQDTSFNKECTNHKLTGNETIYLNLEKVVRTITIKTVGLDTEEEFSVEKKKGDTLTETDLTLDIEDTEVLGYFLDEELETEFSETTVEDDMTVYAKVSKTLKLTESEIETETSDFYENNQYTNNDVCKVELSLWFNKNVNTVNVTFVDTNNNEYDTYVAINGNSVVALYAFSVDEINNSSNTINIVKYLITADTKEFSVEDSSVTFTLEDKELTTLELNQASVCSDYSNYIYTKKRSDSIWTQEFADKWGTTLLTQKDKYYTVESEEYDTLTGIRGEMNFVTIDMDNVEVLYADFTLSEDIYIGSRSTYLRSIFANENYCGNLDLNGHTITLDFNGYAGDGLFTNNYGRIYNGTIKIKGVRDASTGNAEFNTLKNNYAVLKNNYGYIHDVDFYIQNFGFDFDKNHNINYAIEDNECYALVENCTFYLDMTYNGTKLQRIKNPLVGSGAGIFGTVKTGTIYDKAGSYDATQELKKISVYINSANISEELQEAGLVSLTCSTSTNIDLPRFTKNGNTYTYSSVSNNGVFYGGNYYFDGTEYHKYNNAVFTEKVQYELEWGTFYEFNRQIIKDADYSYSTITDMDEISDSYMLTWSESTKTQRAGYIYGSSDYVKSNYCEYGYLTPQFGMVACDTTTLYSLTNNLWGNYSVESKDDLENGSYEYDYQLGENPYDETGETIRVYTVYRRVGVAFTNSYIDVYRVNNGENLNIDYTNIHKKGCLDDNGIYITEEVNKYFYADSYNSDGEAI